MTTVMKRAQALLEQYGDEPENTAGPETTTAPEGGMAPTPEPVVPEEPVDEPTPEEEQVGKEMVAALRKHVTSEALEELVTDFVYGILVQAPISDDVEKLMTDMDPNDVLEAVRQILSLEKMNIGNVVKRLSREFV